VLGGRGEGEPVPDLPNELWSLSWQSTGRSIQVTDPLYGNQRSLSVVEVDSDVGTVTFAVTEVSNGVYRFAVRD
jgi:hypothetical protein